MLTGGQHCQTERDEPDAVEDHGYHGHDCQDANVLQVSYQLQGQIGLIRRPNGLVDEEGNDQEGPYHYGCDNWGALPSCHGLALALLDTSKIPRADLRCM